MKDNPKISIIIPVFNEKEDIITTINYIKKLKYSNYELIIIDDSTDETPQLIKKNKFDKLIYIQPSVRKDRSQARNIGIKKSTGEILVILNADVLLPDDFLDKIIINYKNGCDYLLVDSEVYNLSSVYSRHVDCDLNTKDLKLIGLINGRGQRVSQLKKILRSKLHFFHLVLYQ